MKFLIHSRYGELLDLGLHLRNLGNKVAMYIPDKNYQIIGNGMIPKADNWFRFMGQGITFIFDGCDDGDLQDWLRSKGEKVCGGSLMGDELENNRQISQEWFKAVGFNQPQSENFKDFDSALEFVEKNKDRKWILKQEGDAPKHLSHRGKFDGNEDMLFHLKELKKGWNVAEYGEINFTLMEVVEGLEVASCAYFNGQDYLTDKDEKIIGFLNFEDKKECDGGKGESTGEMGTTFIGLDESNELFHDILMRPGIVEKLRESKFRGIFDINCIVNDKGITALEPTCRFGVPSTSYEFIEGLGNPAEVLNGMAEGSKVVPEIHRGIGMVVCVVAKPFPLEADVEDTATSQGEKLWILNEGKTIKDFTAEQKKHIHLYNFHRKPDMETGEVCYKVATKSGYLYTVTGEGKTVKETRTKILDYIDKNCFVPGQKYRTDIGERIERYAGRVGT